MEAPTYNIPMHRQRTLPLRDSLMAVLDMWRFYREAPMPDCYRVNSATMKRLQHEYPGRPAHLGDAFAGITLVVDETVPDGQAMPGQAWHVVGCLATQTPGTHSRTSLGDLVHHP